MDERELRQGLFEAPAAADERARERAVTRAVAEFVRVRGEGGAKERAESAQGLSLPGRLMGVLNHITRRRMMNKRLIFGGLGSALTAALVAVIGLQVFGVFDREQVVFDSPEYAALERNKLMQSVPPATVLSQSASPRLAPADQLPPQSPAQFRDRDQFEHTDPNRVRVTAEHPLSTFSVDVDTASYAFVRRLLRDGVLPPKDAVRIEEMINYFDYDYPPATDRAQPFHPTVSLFPAPWNPGNRLLHIGIKGFEPPAAERPAANLVFLLDVSGSMAAADKLPLVQSSLRLLLSSLRPDDSIAIVVYAGAAGTVLPPTAVRERGKILAALDALQAGGSTAGAAGIRLAYQLAEARFDPAAVNRVILATDGDFNVGISDPDTLRDFIERKRAGGVYLSVLGFGQGNLNDRLMQQLAQNGNGVAAYIDTLLEARKVLVEEAAAALFPIANDVKVQVEFNPALVAEYRLIGYETRALHREDFHNDAIDAGDIGAGHSVTALYEITLTAGGTPLVDALRYQQPAAGATATTTATANEYALLKLRYKRPGESASQRLTTPITAAHADPAPDHNAGWATAVAAFAQLLRGGRHTGDYTYGDIIRLATAHKGADPFGYRAEFIQLLRLAQSAVAMQAQ